MLPYRILHNAVVVLGLIGCTATWAGTNDIQFKPRKQDVVMTEFTELTLNIVPNLGVLLVFPFQIDRLEADEMLRAKTTIPNIIDIEGYGLGANRKDAVYQSIEPGIGQHSLLINLKEIKTENNANNPYAKESFLGNLFLIVKNYHITIQIRTTVLADHYYSMVVFKESEAKRLYLIEKAIEARKQEQETEFQQRLKQIDDEAEKHALRKLGQVAITDPKTIAIEYEQAVNLPQYGKVVIYLERLLDFGNFVVLQWHFENESTTDVMIKSINLNVISPNNTSQLINAVFDCTARIQRETKQVCALTTQNRDILFMDADNYTYMMHITTDRGSINVEDK